MSTTTNKPDCLFCKIASKKVPATEVYRDDDVCVFEDIHPKAKVHLLLVPTKHIEPLKSATENDEKLLGKMLLLAPKLAKEKGVDETGYRLVINQGQDAGQEVFHLHIHLLGGTKLSGL